MRLPDALTHYMRKTAIPLSLSPANERDHPLVFVNDAFAKLTGYGVTEVIGQNCRFLQGEQSDPDTIVAMRRFLADEDTDTARFQIANYCKDGSVFLNAVFLSRLRSSSGKTQFFFASQFDLSAVSDATEASRYEQDLRASVHAANALAREHQMMLGTSVTTLAHAASTIARSKLYLD